MKNNKITTYFVAVALLCCCKTMALAQDQGIKFSDKPAEVLKASSITWEKHFGGLKKEPNNIYSLMTQGAFRAPTSDNFEKLMNDWLAKHPNAEATVVFILEGTMTGRPNSKWKSVWIADGKESLSIYLVRQGACPAGTMVLNRGDQAQVGQQVYEAFVEKVWEAEQLAKNDKIGIWSESEK